MLSEFRMKTWMIVLNILAERFAQGTFVGWKLDYKRGLFISSIQFYKTMKNCFGTVFGLYMDTKLKFSLKLPEKPRPTTEGFVSLLKAFQSSVIRTILLRFLKLLCNKAKKKLLFHKCITSFETVCLAKQYSKDYLIYAQENRSKVAGNLL